RAGLRQGLPRGRQGHRVPPAADSVPAHGPGGAVPRRVSARPGDEVHIKSNRRRGNWEKPLDFAAVFIYYIRASTEHTPVRANTWRSRVVGRARTIGNRVTVKSRSRVRIPPSPPH